MGNRACSSAFCYGDNDAVSDDERTTTVRTTISKTAAKLWAKQDMRPDANHDDTEEPTEDEDESVDTYYKMLTQHESTNRFSGPRYEQQQRLQRQQQASAAAGDVVAPSLSNAAAPDRASFGDYDRSMSSDTHGREAREGSMGHGRRASMAGEREEMQDDICMHRSASSD